MCAEWKLVDCAGVYDTLLQLDAAPTRQLALGLLGALHWDACSPSGQAPDRHAAAAASSLPAEHGPGSEETRHGRGRRLLPWRGLGCAQHQAVGVTGLLHLISLQGCGARPALTCS